MKKIITIMFLLSASLLADGINWAKDFETGAALAKKEHKPIMFVFSRHSCKYCVVLEETTFSDKKVIEDLNKNFVSIIAYSDEGDKFPQQLWRPGTPTIWFLDDTAQPMFQPLMGAVPAEPFMIGLEEVKKTFNAQNKKAN